MRRFLICLVNAHSEKEWKRIRMITLGLLKNGLNQEKKSWDEKVHMNGCDSLYENRFSADRTPKTLRGASKPSLPTSSKMHRHLN